MIYFLKYNTHQWRAKHYEEFISSFRPFENIDELKQLLEENNYSSNKREDKHYEFCHRFPSDDKHIFSVSTEGPQDWLHLDTGHNCNSRKKKKEIYSVYIEWAKESNTYWVKVFWQSNNDGTQTEPCSNKYYSCNGMPGLTECLSHLKIIN